MIVLGVILGVVVLLGLWLMVSYNNLIRLREMVKNAMGQIAANVESRWDALKSLIDATKKYSAHEAETLEKVVQARGGVNSSSSVNPVIPEVVNQVAFKVIGNDMTITMAAEGGQLELNAFEPVVFYCMFESIDILASAVQTFVDNCVTGITANEARCQELVDHSVGVVTALCPYLGYKKSAELAKKALQSNKSIRDLLLEEKILSAEEIDKILDPVNMTEPISLKPSKH